MTKVDFVAVKAAAPIEKVVGWLGLEGKWDTESEQFRGRCPACNKSDRDIVVTPSKQAFYCHAAKKGGDVIYLTAHCKGVGQVEAGRELTKAFLKTQEAPKEEASGESNPSQHVADTGSIAHVIEAVQTIEAETVVMVTPEYLTADQLFRLAELIEKKKARLKFI